MLISRERQVFAMLWQYSYPERMDSDKQAALAEKARQIIATNRYLALATCANGNPWVATLAYAVDPSYNFYFYSAKSSRHCSHIASNSYVAAAIYDSTLSSESADGLQIAGLAKEVALSELPGVIKLYYEQSFPIQAIRLLWQQPFEAFVGLAVKRFYQINPLEVFKVDPTDPKVDVRVEIDLNTLRTIAAK
jgi:uncharacterized protein YhbP (UPF0306 family)